MFREARWMTGVLRGDADAKVVLMTEVKEYMCNKFSYATMLQNEPADLPEGIFNDTMPMVVHKVMLYMAMKHGLKQLGLRRGKAVSTELLQIHMQNTFKPKYYNDLTQVKQRKALDSLLFLPEKKPGEIKGRMCANGSKQRDDFAKGGEVTSPTVTTDGVIITSAIDAHKERDMAVIDLPGAFLHMLKWTMLSTW